MLVFGQNRSPRCSLDEKYVGQSHHKMDQSMSQTVAKVDQLHLVHNAPPPILFCGRNASRESFYQHYPLFGQQSVLATVTTPWPSQLGATGDRSEPGIPAASYDLGDRLSLDGDGTDKGKACEKLEFPAWPSTDEFRQWKNRPRDR